VKCRQHDFKPDRKGTMSSQAHISLTLSRLLKSLNVNLWWWQNGEMGNALFHTHTQRGRQRGTEAHPVAICRNEPAGLRAGSRHMAAQTDLTGPRPSQPTNNCEMHFDMSKASKKIPKKTTHYGPDQRNFPSPALP